MNDRKLLKTALVSALTVGVASIASTDANAADEMHMTKCYGINAAHKNDCKSPGHSCAGQDTVVRDPNAFVALPTGLCEKIEGGSTTPGNKS